jgi:hypothetical protein
MAPSSAKAKHASSVMTMPMPQTLRNSQGRRVLVATSCAVRKMPDPMIPPASSRMESVRESLRTSFVVWVKMEPIGRDVVWLKNLRFSFLRVKGWPDAKLSNSSGRNEPEVSRHEIAEVLRNE